MSLLSDIFAHPTDRIAVMTEGGDLTYGRLRSDVERAAAYLHDQGVRPETRVGIHLGPFRAADDYAAWVAHLATLFLGATHASVHDAGMLESLVEADLLDVLVGRLPAESEPSIPVIDFIVDDLPESTSKLDPDDSAATRINLTSGTTGTPKAVRWTGPVIDARVRQIADLGVIGPDSIVDSFLGPRTTAGFRYPIATWVAGARLVLSRGSPVTRPAATTLVVCSPFQLDAIRHARRRWPNRDGRTVVALGGRVAPGLRDWLIANVASRVIISFGSTETGNVAHGDATMVDRHPGAVGWVRDDVELEIVDPDGRPVTPGSPGNLRLRTPTMVKADAAPDPNGWFEPGDIAILFDDGLLAIGGRSSDIINYGGMKFSATDLEAELTMADDIRDCAVVTAQSRDGTVLVVAIVPEGDKSARDYAPRLQNKLPKFCRFRVVLARQIPRNAMGKIDRQQIVRQLVANRRAGNREAQRNHA